MNFPKLLVAKPEVSLSTLWNSQLAFHLSFFGIILHIIIFISSPWGLVCALEMLFILVVWGKKSHILTSSWLGTKHIK